MGRKGRVADFTACVTKGGINKSAQLDVEAGIASRSSQGDIRVALLAKCQVGLGSRAVVAWLRPVGWMSHLAVAEGAVETAGLTGSEGGDDLGPQVPPFPVTDGAGRGI